MVVIKSILTGGPSFVSLIDRWLYQAFGQLLDPEICIQLEVGSKPRPNCILEMWRAFHHNKDLGAAYGKVRVLTGTYGHKILNPFIASHRFQDEISTVFPRPFDSLRFLLSPPAPLYAYRYQNVADSMAHYFLGDDTYEKIEKLADILEERKISGYNVLQLEVAARCSITHVASAIVEVHAPFDVEKSIAQRQKSVSQEVATWLYLSSHFSRLLNLRPTLIGNLDFLLNVLYQVIVLIIRWFKMANTWLIFKVILDLTEQEKSGIDPTIIQGHAGSPSLLLTLTN